MGCTPTDTNTPHTHTHTHAHTLHTHTRTHHTHTTHAHRLHTDTPPCTMHTPHTPHTHTHSTPHTHTHTHSTHAHTPHAHSTHTPHTHTHTHTHSTYTQNMSARQHTTHNNTSTFSARNLWPRKRERCLISDRLDHLKGVGKDTSFFETAMFSHVCLFSVLVSSTHNNTSTQHAHWLWPLEVKRPICGGRGGGTRPVIITVLMTLDRHALILGGVYASYLLRHSNYVHSPRCDILWHFLRVVILGHSQQEEKIDRNHTHPFTHTHTHTHIHTTISYVMCNRRSILFSKTQHLLVNRVLFWCRSAGRCSSTGFRSNNAFEFKATTSSSNTPYSIILRLDDHPASRSFCHWCEYHHQRVINTPIDQNVLIFVTWTRSQIPPQLGEGKGIYWFRGNTHPLEFWYGCGCHHHNHLHNHAHAHTHTHRSNFTFDLWTRPQYLSSRLHR
jgi:hypothetical protein